MARCCPVKGDAGGSNYVSDLDKIDYGDQSGPTWTNIDHPDQVGQVYDETLRRWEDASRWDKRDDDVDGENWQMPGGGRERDKVKRR